MKFADDAVSSNNKIENRAEKGGLSEGAPNNRLFEEAYDNKAAGKAGSRDVDSKNSMGKQAEHDESSSLKKAMPKESIDGLKKSPEEKAGTGDTGSQLSKPNNAGEPLQKFLDIPPLQEKKGSNGSPASKLEDDTEHVNKAKPMPNIHEDNRNGGSSDASSKNAAKPNEGAGIDNSSQFLKKGEAVDSLHNR